jgi:hypothetical protein
MRKILLASAAMLATASAPPPSRPGAAAASPAAATNPPAPAAASGTAPAGVETTTERAPQPRFPGFGAVLGNARPIDGPSGWAVIPRAAAWAAIANATRETRQQLRWDYARSLIGSSAPQEAIGVLDVMLADDPDLAFVPAFALARGAALTMLGHSEEAASLLALPELAANGEACAWRLLALGGSGREAEALTQIRCALPAIRARDQFERRPFILSAAGSALTTGQAELALRWLDMVADSDPAANLLRGRSYFALGKIAEGRLRLGQARQNGNAEEKLDARLSLIEAAATHGGVPAKAAIRQLDAISSTWRGGDIEERALRLSYQLAAKTNDVRTTLAAGSLLFRYFQLGHGDNRMLAGLQATLLAALEPDSKMPLDQAAGLFWDYRDLAPAGAGGDYLVSRLADRLQSAGLYGRAAELLEHQLFARTTDIAQGPLSARVASLYIQAGRPDRAVDVLRRTDAVPYPADMLAARQRVEAVALTQLGKTNEALAILQSVPGGAALRSEILWRRRDWANLAAIAETALPKGKQLSDVGQTVLLRQAIALAMLGREAEIARLRSRYSASFAGQASANLFDILTRPAGTIDPALVGKAMAGVPSASPAGELADLLDAQVEKKG